MHKKLKEPFNNGMNKDNMAELFKLWIKVLILFLVEITLNH